MSAQSAVRARTSPARPRTAPQNPPAPRLKVVRAPLHARTRMPFILACMAVLAGALLSALLLNTSMASTAYAKYDLSNQLGQLDQDAKDKQADLDAQASPAHLAAAAAALGMVPTNGTGLAAGCPTGACRARRSRPGPPDDDAGHRSSADRGAPAEHDARRRAPAPSRGPAPGQRAAATAGPPRTVEVPTRTGGRPPRPGSRGRMAFLTIVVVLTLVVFGGRLVYVQGLRGPSIAEQARDARLVSVAELGGRGEITDADGVALAASVERYDISVNQKTVPEYRSTGSVGGPDGAAGVAARLAPLLDMNAAELGGKLVGDRGFVYIKKGVLPDVAREVRKLGLPGVNVDRVAERVYPNGTLAGNVLGFVNSNGIGPGGPRARARQAADRDGRQGDVRARPDGSGDPRRVLQGDTGAAGRLGHAHPQVRRAVPGAGGAERAGGGHGRGLGLAHRDGRQDAARSTRWPTRTASTRTTRATGRAARCRAPSRTCSSPARPARSSRCRPSWTTTWPRRRRSSRCRTSTHRTARRRSTTPTSTASRT